MAASILIADDYDDNRELLRLILEMSGYRTEEARNGREAVEAARENGFALALIDLSMPVLDGYGALRELRADPKTRRLPCIALTAFAGDHDRQRALDAGFDAYVAKPYQPQDLLSIMERLLRDANDVGTNDARFNVSNATARPLTAITGNFNTNDTNAND